MSNQLIEAQRYEIYLGLKRKWSKTRIAKEIGVSKSTVSREIQRNSKPDGEYVWRYAQKQCDLRKHGFKGNHRKPEELWWRIEQMILEEDWSPAQIAGVLKKEGIHICKQTIYNHVHASRVEILKETQGFTSYQSDEHSQSHQYPFSSHRGRWKAFWRLGDGHNRGFFRTCNPYFDRKINKLSAYGKIA